MRVASAVIENFRHIDSNGLELNFTDSVGRVRDVSVLVGPNTSGKTTVLDALATGLGLITELPYSRPDLVLTPPAIVRRGALQARVTCRVRFSPEEIETTRQLYRLAEEDQEIPDVEDVTIIWEYPDRMGQYPRGYVRCEPRDAWRLFKGRVKVARLLSTGRVDWSWFERVGGVFTFDQQRTGMGKIIPRDIWDIIHGGGNESDSSGERRTTDPRTILLALAVQSLVPSVDERRFDQFKHIQERYAEICAPHHIKEVVQDELGQFDIIFTDGTYEYRYGGLSSGEQMLLLFLIRMVTENVHQSIVLVDEIELHQHPLWQRKLLYLLPRIGRNNQIIATTHSAYLRDVLPQEAIIDLGELGDRSRC
jgi:predicted ATPase